MTISKNHLNRLNYEKTNHIGFDTSDDLHKL